MKSLLLLALFCMPQFVAAENTTVRSRGTLDDPRDHRMRGSHGTVDNSTDRRVRGSHGTMVESSDISLNEFKSAVQVNCWGTGKDDFLLTIDQDPENLEVKRITLTELLGGGKELVTQYYQDQPAYVVKSFAGDPKIKLRNMHTKKMVLELNSFKGKGTLFVEWGDHERKSVPVQCKIVRRTNDPI